jgi:hypothetical protein
MTFTARGATPDGLGVLIGTYAVLADAQAAAVAYTKANRLYRATVVDDSIGLWLSSFETLPEPSNDRGFR